ncbi:acetyl-coenzyme A synthetase, partial [Candidatus Magnetobacterium bavaricum]
MAEGRLFPPPTGFSDKARIKDMDEYDRLYKRSVEDTEGFWAEMAQTHLHWFKGWDTTLRYDFKKPFIKWFEGGKLNV